MTEELRRMDSNHPSQVVCFLELNPQLSMLKRGAAEFIGTLLLVLIVVGAKLYGAQAVPTDQAASNLAGAVAAGSALAGLILALGVISGGHFNPLITILQYMTRRRGGLCALVYIAGQLSGGTAGAVLATFAFGATRLAGGPQNPAHGWLLAELLSSAGLMLVVFGCMKSARTEFGALGVAAWLTGSVLGLPNTFGNPALALGAKSALGGALTWYHLELAIAAELGGAFLAAAVVAYLFPREISLSPPVAVEEAVKREGASQSDFRT